MPSPPRWSKATAKPDGGFSLPIAVLAAFLLLLGSLSLANRSGLGLLGSGLISRNKSARDAAETGMSRIVGELNRPRNRWLTVVRNNGVNRDPDFENAGVGDLWQNRNNSAVLIERRVNPCVVAQAAAEGDTTPDYSGLEPGNAVNRNTYGRWFINRDGSISADQGTADRSFRLVRVTRQPYAGAIGANQRDINNDGNIDENDRYLSVWRDRRDNPTGVGTITIDIEGQSYQNGNVVASVILQKTFELTPKCCQVPFGGTHGNIDYDLDDSGSTVCLQQIGLGLLAGTEGTNSGSITVRGRATDIEDESGNDVSPIYCIASNQDGCTVDNNDPDIRVATVDFRLPPAYTFCNPPQGAASYAPNNPCPDAPIGAFDSPFFEGKEACTNEPTFACKQEAGGGGRGGGRDRDGGGGGGGYVINSSQDGYPNFCRRTRDNSQLHCNVSKIDLGAGGNKDLFFVTGSRDLFLYFPNAGPVIDQRGNITIHNCESYLNSICTPSDKTTSLSLFGSNNSLNPQQEIKLTGTAGLDNNMFIYFPTGKVSLQGNSDFQGVLWTNNLSSVGNPTWTLSLSGLTDVYSLMGLTGANTNQIEPTFFDFVLRGTNLQRWLGG